MMTSASCFAEADVTGRVGLITGASGELAYMPRLRAIRSLAEESPLSAEELPPLTNYLRAPDPEGTDEMEMAALKNDLIEHLIQKGEGSGRLAQDLLDMQADAALSQTWRDYCIQFMEPVYAKTPDTALRTELRERLYQLMDSPLPQTCGTALLALSALSDNPEMDSVRVAARSLALARDGKNTDGLRLSALQVAARTGQPSAAVATAREWLAVEKSVNLKAVAIGVLGKYGTSGDKELVRPYLDHADPRLSASARAALGLPRVQRLPPQP